jgi:hypothetical protein
MEWLWVRDIVDLTWDILRYRRLKAKWIQHNKLEAPRLSSDKESYSHQLSPFEMTTSAYGSLNLIEQMQASAELRCNNALSEIEARRASLAQALRHAFRPSHRSRSTTAARQGELRRMPSPASPRRVAANRRNAQRSTGPRSPDGKDRARRNAWRHGLAACVVATAPRDPELRRLTNEIAGPNADPCRSHFAEIAAEAEFELRRVRAARLSLIAPLVADVVKTEDRDVDPDRPDSSALLKTLVQLDRYEQRATSRRNRELRLL